MVKRVFAILLFLILPAAAHAEWTPEIKLSGDGPAMLNENMGQAIVATGKTLHVIWCQGAKSDTAIYYRHSLDGGATWADAVRVSAKPANDGWPLIAVSGSTVHLVFLRDQNTPQSASYYKRSTDNGATWEPDVLLGETKWWPSVAAVGQNVYVALETLVTPDNSEVFFRRSTDGGTTWEAQQQISNSIGRSEDPCISAEGSNVYIAWNDNRDTLPPNKGMAYYFRRSTDKGATWGAETAVTKKPAFTYMPNVFGSGADVDIAYGDQQTGVYNVCYQHSGDQGATWGPAQKITNSDKAPQFYPSVVRDGANVHLVWGAATTSLMYQHSTDGGATWEPAAKLNDTRQGCTFIAVSGTAVHVIWADKRGGIYYKSNPAGNPIGATVATKTDK
jgi:hypothetical protein